MELIEKLNEYIHAFNKSLELFHVPNFQSLGTRSYWDATGVYRRVHRWNEWQEYEYEEKKHLSDKMRVKMGQYVVKYFQGERLRKGVLI